VSPDTKRLLRYLDREMSRDEAEQFRARLAESPALRQQLAEMQRVGALVRCWASAAEARAGELVEPTLVRVRESEHKRRRHASLGYALAAILLVVLPWSRRAPELTGSVVPGAAVLPAGAAIERVEAVDQQAQVFVLGSSTTPVVWLADDVADDDVAQQQGPG
jgi:anti-sigma factor RsiW